MPALSVRLRQDTPIPLDAEFSCDSGEFVALVGPSGSGKTTILRTIAGLAKCAEGRIAIEDTAWFDSAAGISLSPQQRRVGFVFQHYALFPHMTAVENVAIAASRSDAGKRAHELLARMKLEGLADRRPALLSGGQQQRVALARALARDPRVLLDEPFSAVDLVTRQDLYVELAELRRTFALPIVLVTHDLLEAQRLADRVIILDAGTTLQAGTPAEVLARPRSARVARLLGLRNHFDGVFHRAAQGAARGGLTWGRDAEGLRLPVIDKGRIEDGAAVTWVVPGQGVALSATPDAGTCHFRCRLVDAVALGDVTQCVVELADAPRAQVTATLATQNFAALQLGVGGPVWLRLDPDSIHIMPVRHRPH
jgi:molybdate transport system ATP-binding protein